MSQGNIIVKLNGGLGNQMFQWALARMLEETTNIEVFLDMSYFGKRYARPYQLDIFKIEPNFIRDAWTKFILDVIWTFRAFLHWEKTFGYILYSEKQFNFDSGIQKVKPNTYIEGFFQSELYFKCIEERIRRDFEFDPFLEEENRKIVNMMSSGNPVSLHIRRGDYVQKEKNQEIYANCSLDYYRRAAEFISIKVERPVFFIFSDDIKWAKEHLRLPYECVYVSHNIGEKSPEDMRLMSLCEHNIIANSSFSWWGAWLNKNKEKIVIAPKKWFNDDSIIQTDIIPKEWLRIAN